MTVKDIYESFTHKMAAKASWHRNYVTVILCITSLTELNWSLQTVNVAGKRHVFRARFQSSSVHVLVVYQFGDDGNEERGGGDVAGEARDALRDADN